MLPAPGLGCREKDPRPIDPDLSRRQHDVVGAVATHWRFERIRCDQGEPLGKQPNGGGGSCIQSALMKFSSQDIAQFVEQESRRNHGVMADAVLQKIAADAARDEGRDEDVRVEEQPHETRLNTS